MGGGGRFPPLLTDLSYVSFLAFAPEKRLRADITRLFFHGLPFSRDVGLWRRVARL